MDAKVEGDLQGRRSPQAYRNYPGAVLELPTSCVMTYGSWLRIAEIQK